MTSDTHKNIEVAFTQALALDESDREKYLTELRERDPNIYDAVMRLLAADAKDDAALRAPIAESVSRLGIISDDRWIGKTIGAFLITERIAAGGMGVVFLAERSDKQYEQQVAIKIMSAQLLAPDAAARFRAERQILANLDHPYIANLIDGGTTEEGLPYLVLEYIDGRPIDRYCDERQLDVRGRLELFGKVCEAVDYAHRKLVVHRDLKPSNILVDDRGNPRLLDFGIAKLISADTFNYTVVMTRAGFAAMTPEYASPEQVRGESISVAMDVYSLGVLLYKILCGRMPYEGIRNLPGNIERAILEMEPSRPSTALTAPTDPSTSGVSVVEISLSRGTTIAKLKSALSGDLDNIVLAALRKKPERRYPSAAAFSDDIQRYLQHRPVVARGDSTTYRLTKFIRRRRVGVSIAALIVVIIVASGIRIIAERDRAALAARQSQEVSGFLRKLFENASPFVSQGNEITALDLLDEGAKEIGRLDDQPAVQAELYAVMGESYGFLGQGDRSIPMLLRSLEIFLQMDGVDSLSLADAYAGLSEAQRLDIQLEAAEQNARRALTLREQTLGPNHPVVAMSLGRLAVVLFDRRNMQQAKPLLERAVRIKRSLGQIDDEVGVDIMGNLANALDSLGHYDEAIPIHKETVALSRKLLGDLHPNTIIRIGNLGGVYLAVSRFEEAGVVISESIELGRQVWPPKHPQVTFLLSRKAVNSKYLGNLDEALALYQQTADLAAEHSGEQSVAYVARLRGLGSVLGLMGRHDQAREVFTKGLDLVALLDIEDAYQSSMLRIYFGLSMNEQSRFAEAEALIRRALGQRDLLGAENTLIAQRELARSLSGQGKDTEAEALFLGTISGFERMDGPNSASLVEYLTPTAAHFRRTGQFAEALEHAERSSQLGRTKLPDGNWITAFATVEYAKALEATGQDDEAQEYFQIAHADLLVTFGADDPRVTEVAGHIEN